MTLETIKKQIVPSLKYQGAIKVAIFGSHATDTAKKNSDIDILVKFSPEISLLKLSGLKIKLEEKVGKKIDILTYSSINPKLKKRILGEQKIIYEKRSKDFS